MKPLVLAALAVHVIGFSKNVDEAARSGDFLSRACAQWTLTADDVQYFEINGGSFGVVLGTSPDGASYYGCKDRCAKLFPFHLYGDE
jgi:hypothetical protein